eukprot:GHVN01086883.1.p2 GENE.GHVN01086883.1~~GHVN01086883.1.p2  ORF type:complete len:109 (+),score=49.72 GHVN01086883.1:1367-1693(+)
MSVCLFDSPDSTHLFTHLLSSLVHSHHSTHSFTHMTHSTHSFTHITQLTHFSHNSTHSFTHVTQLTHLVSVCLFVLWLFLRAFVLFVCEDSFNFLTDRFFLCLSPILS